MSAVGQAGEAKSDASPA